MLWPKCNLQTNLIFLNLRITRLKCSTNPNFLFAGQLAIKLPSKRDQYHVEGCRLFDDIEAQGAEHLKPTITLSRSYE